MDLSYGEKYEEFGQEVHTFLEKYRGKVPKPIEWQKILIENGYAARAIAKGIWWLRDLLGLHYWFKRIGFNRQMLGAPEMIREEAARVQNLC